MPLITCHECNKEISSSAEICPNCGFPIAKVKKEKAETISKRDKRNGCLIAVGGLITLIVIVGWCNRNDRDNSDQTNEKVALTPSQLDAINSLESDGYLRIDYQLNTAYLSPLLWASIDYQTKENLSYSLAIYCGNKKGTHLYWVDIYDNMSGKKLAKYSQSWGFKVYE